MRQIARNLILLFRAVSHALRFGTSFRDFLRETGRIGTESILLVAVGMAFFGAVLIEHGASQAKETVGDITLVGSAWFEILIRDLSPTIAGMLAAVRVGAALSAEVAAMKVTHQLDALELCSGDIFADIAFPRIAGGIAAIPCLIVIGTLTAALSASQWAFRFYGADPGAFLDASLVGLDDLSAFAVKSVVFAAAIPLCAVESGLSAKDGESGVGEATTRGVVQSCLAVLLLNVVLSLYFFALIR